MRHSFIFSSFLLVLCVTYVTSMGIAGARAKQKRESSTTDLEGDLDGKKFDLPKDGETITCGYSENQRTDPDGNEYPGYSQCGARAAQAGEKLGNPGGSGVSAQSGGIGAASAGDDEPDPEDPNQPPSEGAGRKKRETVHGGTSECNETCFWVQPYWVVWRSAWWPVVQAPKFKQWLKYCFCSSLNQSCTHFIEGSQALPGPWWMPPVRMAYCSKCTTEWGWRHIWVWWRCKPIRIWLQIPVGCCCGLKGIHYCPTIDPPTSFKPPVGPFFPV
ncbi:uncharacterized protein LOC106166260 [Lingula anatina]|uniref:Uncharacterized protein LOC106166260 n=1 Tax=Lingula anatina TaxID=7574 RepID=A0A1S3IPQ9_LINAN|nr:uncharacterized protein LOC106166260 [Lingula anatina]|eukprot:XP_013400205.1 uncharacterized protein LOC106166260 [Lingula anatina]